MHYECDIPRYSSSRDASNHQSPIIRSKRQRLDQRLVPSFEVEDVRDAHVPNACAVYASAVLCQTSFAYMDEWFTTRNFWNRKSGVDPTHVLSCLQQHNYDVQAQIFGNGVHLKNIGTLRSLFKCNMYYLLVYATHMNVYYNGMINERFLGGWIPVEELDSSRDINKDACKNRIIDEIYKIAPSE